MGTGSETQVLVVWKERVMCVLRINKILSDLKKGTKISEEKLLTFLLGEQNEYITRSERNKLKNRKRSFAGLRRDLFLASSDWGKERILRILGENGDSEECEKVYNALLKNAKKIHKEYIGKEFNNNDVSKIFEQIATLVWLKTPYSEEIFERKLLSDEKYISWEEKETEIKTTIQNENIIFVCGTAACGKRRLVEHYLNKNVCADYVFAEVFSVEGKRKVQVKYQYGGLREISLESFLEQCKWREKEDYLILIWHYFTGDEINSIFQWVREHHAKVIIITRMREIPKGYKKIEIEQWPKEGLMKIAQRCFEKRTSKQDYKKFFEILHYNPFLVEVFSTYLALKSESKDSFCHNAKREGEVEQLALSKGSKVRCSYRIDAKNNNPLPIATVLARCLLPCPDDDIRMLCELVVWTRTLIDKDFIIKMGGFKEEIIDDLIAKNYLIYNEKKQIQMYPVFVWAVDALKIELTTERPDETDTGIKVLFDERKILFNESGMQSGMHLLNSMIGNEKCTTMYIQYFYRVIENIICRYHRIYSANTNLTNKKRKRYYNQWTEFLEKAIRQIREMGNCELAAWIDERIYTKYKKKNREENITDEQRDRKKWEQFILKLMQGSREEDWDEIIDIVRDGVFYNEIHFLIDMYIYMEIYDIALEFADTADDKYVKPKRRGMLGLLDTYFGMLNNYGVNDDMQYLYSVVKYYLKAFYEERRYIDDARCSLHTFDSFCNKETNSELIFRAKIYNLFFELIIYWKDYPVNPQVICAEFGVFVEAVFRQLQETSYSIWTTNSAIVCLHIASALVPIRLMGQDWEKYVQELQSGKFDLFQKLADVNKYQYQISDEHYQELLDVIKNATEGISKVYEKVLQF